MKHYSCSQANMFLRCGAQYKYRYVDGIKSPPASAMIQGTSYHKAIEVNFGQKVTSKVDLPLADVKDAYSTEFDQKILEVEDLSSDDKGDLKDEGVKIVEEYHVKRAPSVMPIAVEKAFKIEFDNVDYTLDGFIDVVEEGVVIENKTTAKTPSDVSADHMLQGIVYALAEGIDSVTFDYAVKLKTPKIVSFQKKIVPADTDFALKLVGNIHHAIQNEVFIPNRNSFMCSKKHCAYWNSCEKDHGGRIK